jgi:hypothetical protein
MLTAADGEIIAKKLGAFIKPKSRRHKIAIVRIRGTEVGRFNIRRGSGELSHNYIPHQIHVSMREAEEIAGCTRDFSDYDAILKRGTYYPV